MENEIGAGPRKLIEAWTFEKSQAISKEFRKDSFEALKLKITDLWKSKRVYALSLEGTHFFHLATS